MVQQPLEVGGEGLLRPVRVGLLEEVDVLVLDGVERVLVVSVVLEVEGQELAGLGEGEAEGRNVGEHISS